MPARKRLPKINSSGGTPYKTKGATFWDNGSVAFRTQAEKEEIEELETKRLVAGMIANEGFKRINPEEQKVINNFRDFASHEKRVLAFKRKAG